MGPTLSLPIGTALAPGQEAVPPMPEHCVASVDAHDNTLKPPLPTASGLAERSSCGGKAARSACR
jgi:hypothetical protein